MHVLITAITYLSLLLLLMSGTVTGILGVSVLGLFGLALILWKKPRIKERPKAGQILVSAFSAAYLGLHFYNRWIPSSKVRSIAALLHMPVSVLVGVTAALLSLCSVFIMVFALQQVAGGLAKAEEKQRWKGIALCCFIASLATVFLSQVMIDLEILSMKIQREFRKILKKGS